MTISTLDRCVAAHAPQLKRLVDSILFVEQPINCKHALDKDATWNAAEGDDRYFISGEDLTTQAGLAARQAPARAV